MARPLNTDYLHSMRYQVTTNDGNNPLINLTPDGRPEAGFSAVTTPEATVEAVEYKEGTMIYTQKYPGNPSMSDITLSRGVARLDSSFYRWMRLVMEGAPVGSAEAEYRTDLDIKHFHRDTALTGNIQGTENLTSITTDNPARIYRVKQAFITRHKVAGDLDATASEISIMEMDVAYENFEVIENEA